MKKKRVVAMFMVAAMAFGMLTGCGDSPSDVSSGTSESEKQESSESNAADDSTANDNPGGVVGLR